MQLSGFHGSRHHKRFRMKAAFTQRRKSLWINRKTENHIRFIAILFFVGIGLIVSIGSRTLLSWNIISRIFFAFAVITSFLPKRFFPVLYRVRKELKILFTVCALSPMLTGGILLVNYSFLTNISTEAYKIESVKRYSNDYMFTIYLENNKLENFQSIRSFSSDDYPFRPDSAHYIIGTGVFNIDVVRKSYLTP